jgi:hypothetical protein
MVWRSVFDGYGIQNTVHLDMSCAKMYAVHIEDEQ